MLGFAFRFAMVVLSAAALSSANGGFPAGEGKDLGSESASGAPADHGVYFAPAMRFDADAGSLEVTFGIEEAARLSLYAFDSQGKLLAVLLDGNQMAGFHHLSLFSNRLQGYAGRAVFQLRAGQSVLAETRPRAL
ncbi:MAG: hypothetical protein ABI036_12845 [Fibrobacteria bacterium]